MNNTQLYIPKKVKVGFQKRDNTYTGKLGYVIYWDDKGILRKEKSWESWRHKEDGSVGRVYNAETKIYEYSDETYGESVKPIELTNEPIEGFVLNRDAGGVRSGRGWDARIEKVRVYDPRGFEFEISIPNLLFILQECNAIKGKGLDGEFVYSWDKTELVLLPICSAEYRECQNFTKLQAKTVSKKDLKPGFLYKTKGEEKLCYIGRDYFVSGEYGHPKVRKEHIVWTWNSYSENGGSFGTLPNNVAEELGECKEYNEILEKFSKTNHGVAVKEVVIGDEIKEPTTNDRWSYRKKTTFSKSRGIFLDGETFVTVDLNRYYRHEDYEKESSFVLKNGELKPTPYKKDLDTSEYYDYHLLLENGAELQANPTK